MRPRRFRVLLLLVAALLIVVGTVPAGAANNRDRTLSVMSRNLYLGADFLPLFGAGSEAEFYAAAGMVYESIVASDFPTRADAIAGEIEDVAPDVIGLQEVVDAEVLAPGGAEFDFLETLLVALDDHGLHYEVVVEGPAFGGMFPALIEGAVVPVDFTDRDVILARTDVKTSELKLSNEQHDVFEAALTLPTALGVDIIVERGWTSVDVKIRGSRLRLINTHFEAFHPGVRAEQAMEVLEGPAGTSLPVIILGDLNSDPASPLAIERAAYAAMIAAGFGDAWDAAGVGDGFTCCQAANLLNAASLLDERIDFVLHRGGFDVMDVLVTGNEPLDDVPNWASDHAGVAAWLVVPRPGRGR